MNQHDDLDDESWECPTCLQPFPPENDYECGTCEAKASEHLRVTTMCKLLRETQRRESALIVENNEQARLLGMSAERECDLRGKIERLELNQQVEALKEESSRWEKQWKAWENKWKCAVEMAAQAETDKYFLEEKLAAERGLSDRLAEALLSFCSSGMVWPNTDTPEKAIAAWKEARND